MSDKINDVFYLSLPLVIHPALRGAPRLANDDAQMLAWREGFHRSRRMPPLYVDAENRIVDGRHRYWCAQSLQWPVVPCLRVDEEEIATVILETLNNRRHYSKGARAYLSYPFLRPAFDEAKRRKLINLKNVKNSIETNSVRFEAKTPAQFAEQMALSIRLLEQAKEVHDLFEKDTGEYSWSEIPPEVAELFPGKVKMTLEEYFEPQILREESPLGLGSVLKGIAYKQTHAPGNAVSSSRPGRDQKELFEESAETFFEYVCGMSDLAEAAPAIRAIVASIESDEELQRLEALAREIEKQIAARKEILARVV